MIRARKSDAIYFQRIQDRNRFVHLHHTGAKGGRKEIAVLEAHRTLPATEIVQAVIHAVTEFAAGAPQADDITLLVAKRL